MSKEHVPAAVLARPCMLERLRDPATAAAYINAAAHEDDPSAFLQALRNVAEARGGLTKIATRADLNRQQLYRTLSSAGNPELRSLTRILEAAGLQLIVTAKPERRARTAKKRAAKSEAVAVAAWQEAKHRLRQCSVRASSRASILRIFTDIVSSPCTRLMDS